MNCHECNGARLKKEVLAVRVGDKNINELTSMSIDKDKGLFKFNTVK